MTFKRTLYYALIFLFVSTVDTFKSGSRQVVRLKSGHFFLRLDTLLSAPARRIDA